MAITFCGVPIPGDHGDIVTGSLEVMRTPTQTMGLKGETEVIGRAGPRDAEIEHFLFGSFATGAACQAALDVIGRLQTRNGRLAETGAIVRNFDNVTLLQVSLVSGPFPLIGHSTISGFTGWGAKLKLVFRQLKVP